MKKRNTKRIMRTYKLENIFTIVMVIIDIISLFTHIKLNGFYQGLGLEIIIMYSSIILFRYLIKTYRKSF